MDTNEDVNTTGINATGVDKTHNNKIPGLYPETYENHNEEEFTKSTNPDSAMPKFLPTTPPVEDATILKEVEPTKQQTTTPHIKMEEVTVE